MPQLLHYPQNRRTLAQVAKQACINPMEAEHYAQLLSKLNKTATNQTLPAHTPIILPGDTQQAGDVKPIPRCSPLENQTIATLNRQIGGARTLALADLVQEITQANSPLAAEKFASDNASTFIGGGGSALRASSNSLQASILSFQHELNYYDDLRVRNLDQAAAAHQHGRMRRAYDNMHNHLNRRGQHFLTKHAFKTRQITSLNGTIVSQSIPLTDSTYFRNLTDLAKIGRIAGYGMIALDGYMRYDKVADMYKANNPEWKRQAVIEGVSFAASIGLAAGIASIVVLATPVGLLLGFVIGGAIAVGVDKILKEAVEYGYDKLQ